jgi:hypothetical protein
LVKLLLDPDPRIASEAFDRLCESLASPSRVAAPMLIGELIAALDDASDITGARIFLLLGILCERPDPEADHRDGPELPAVLAGLDRYLRLAPRARENREVRLALFYLLAHFPQEADRIIDAVGGISDPDAVSRLRRSLTSPDFSDPGTADQAGRCWPSPAILAFTPDELASTASARRAMPREAVEMSWESDTRALIAYAGGYAAAAVTGGE